MSERRECFGCVDHESSFSGDGGYTFHCRQRPGLVLGSINLVENDKPMEIDRCHSARAALTAALDTKDKA